MTVLNDEWTPLFGELENRVSAEGRRRVLMQMIGDVYDVTVLNFGETGLARPEAWAQLNEKYAEAKHDGNRTPTLILTGELKKGFVVEFDSESATLSNSVPYATEHQFGESYQNLPARPFYPVDENGLTFTPFMVNRLQGILEAHFQT